MILAENQGFELLSETYARIAIANQSWAASLLFGSCFVEDRFTRS